VLLFALCRSARADVSFVHEIAPIVLKRCVGCHGDKINLGGYRANTFEYLMKRTASGAQPVKPGDPDGSAIFRLISTSNTSLRMPKGDDPLSLAQIALIRRWIFEGAKFDGNDSRASLAASMGPRKHPAAPTAYRTAQPILALAIIPSNSSAVMIAVGGYNEVTIWNGLTGLLVRRIGDLPQRIQSLQCSSDGASLLVAGGTPGEYGEVDIVNLKSAGKPELLGTYSDISLAAVYDKSGGKIAVGGADGAVSEYDAASGRRLWTSAIHSDWVTSVSFSSDGKFVASAGKDMTVKIHNAQDGSLYTTYTGHCRQLGQYKTQDPVYAVRFLPNSSLAVSAGGGKWIQMWDPVKAKEEAGSAADMEERFAKQGHAKYIEHDLASPVLALAVSGDTVFGASADGLVKQFDLSTLKEVRSFTGCSDWVYALDFDASRHLLAAGTYSGEMRVWDTETGKCIAAFVASPGEKHSERIAGEWTPSK
jgi:hypothetical protein